jgi:hypothetical protein
MFQTKVVEKIKTHTLSSVTFFPENRADNENVGKYGTAEQATDGSKIRRKRFACWIHKVTDTHSEYVLLIIFFTTEMVREKRLHVSTTECHHQASLALAEASNRDAFDNFCVSENTCFGHSSLATPASQ